MRQIGINLNNNQQGSNQRERIAPMKSWNHIYICFHSKKNNGVFDYYYYYQNIYGRLLLFLTYYIRTWAIWAHIDKTHERFITKKMLFFYITTFSPHSPASFWPLMYTALYNKNPYYYWDIIYFIIISLVTWIVRYRFGPSGRRISAWSLGWWSCRSSSPPWGKKKNGGKGGS